MRVFPLVAALGLPLFAFAAPDLHADGESPLERVWAGRDAALDASIAAYEKAAERSDATPLVFERLCRMRFFRASERLPAGSKEMYREYERAVADGLRGVNRLAKQGGSAFADAGDLDDGLASVPNPAVGILYWTALSYGSTIEDMSVFRQPGAAKRFKRLVERCLALDETYFHAGPHRALAGFLAQAPGIMGGDKELAKTHADAAVRLAPKYADNYVQRAENAWLPAKDRTKYEADMDAALALSDDAAGAESVPEQKAAKGHARDLKVHAGDKF
jgi:hypothetical protein